MCLNKNFISMFTKYLKHHWCFASKYNYCNIWAPRFLKFWIESAKIKGIIIIFREKLKYIHCNIWYFWIYLAKSIFLILSHRLPCEALCTICIVFLHIGTHQVYQSWKPDRLSCQRTRLKCFIELMVIII